MDSHDSRPDSGPDRTDETTHEQSNGDGPSSLRTHPLSRRGTLAALLGLGGLVVGGSEAGAAQQGARPWNRDVNANGYDLFDLGSLAMDNPNPAITDFAGTNLSIDGNGVLNVSSAVQTDIYDDGSQVVADAEILDFGANLSVSGSGSTATVDADTWDTDVDAGGNRLVALGSLAMDNSNPELVEFAGTNLSIDGNGTLNATDTRTDVSDDGGTVVTDTEDINFASNLSVTDDGDGSVTVDADSTWEDTDSDNLLEASGFDGIDVDTVRANLVATPKFGTTTDTALEGVVNDERFLRVVDTSLDTPVGVGDADPAPNIIAGYKENSVGSDVVGATISGGGGVVSDATESNCVEAKYGTVGGGRGNNVAGIDGTVAGGQFNDASKTATVGGGGNNKAVATESTVAGGSGNEATARYATVPGGEDNEANGSGSFAAGQQAKAVDDNAIVWNDGSAYHSSLPGFSSEKDVNGEPVTGADTFSASAQGGVRFITGSSSVTYISSGSTGWSATSTRAAKTNIDPVNPGEILDGVDEMEVATWEYTDEDGDGKGVRHIGPMAEEFHDAVDVGDSDEHINSINADGVLFAAVQALSRKLDDADDELARKDERLTDLEDENEELRERLAAVEDRLTTLEATQPSPAADD